MKAADITTEKQRLRRAMRPLLEQVTPAAAQAAGAAVADQLARTDLWRLAARVALFASRPDEVDMGPLIRRARTDAKPVLLPRMLASGGLEFVVLSMQHRLREGPLGVLEPPQDAPAVQLAPDDLVLLPGLAYDRQGGRLGRGRGYYDRALANRRDSDSRPLLIGVGFGFQIVERVPMTPLDVRLDGIVSELELIETESSRQWCIRVRGIQGRPDRDD